MLAYVLITGRLWRMPAKAQPLSGPRGERAQPARKTACLNALGGRIVIYERRLFVETPLFWPPSLPRMSAVYARGGCEDVCACLVHDGVSCWASRKASLLL